MELEGETDKLTKTRKSVHPYRAWFELQILEVEADYEDPSSLPGFSVGQWNISKLYHMSLNLAVLHLLSFVLICAFLVHIFHLFMAKHYVGA